MLRWKDNVWLATKDYMEVAEQESVDNVTFGILCGGVHSIPQGSPKTTGRVSLSRQSGVQTGGKNYINGSFAPRMC
jgi:hypothetical protein